MRVLPIKPEEAHPWLLRKHYARRLCPISYAFGLYECDILRGVVTYGVPASSALRAGVCGGEWENSVIELNRLCCDGVINAASALVGGSLRYLPKPSIVVSYADTAQGHVGYVYQATNFIYTGLSAKRTDWRVRGMEHLHGATIADISRGSSGRANYMRERFGNDFYLEDRSRKHRYIYFCGSKTQRKHMMASLNYAPQPYPKGNTSRYDAGAEVETQRILFA